MIAPKRLTLVVTPELHAELEAIADDTGRSMSEVFRAAFALFKTCHNAKRQGQYIGLVSDPSKLDREIVGLL